MSIPRCLVLILVAQACSDPSPPSVVRLDPYRVSFTTDADLPPGTIALTFDDGPDPATTRQILDVLDAHDVDGTFFQVGRMIETHPEVSAEIAARGHALGSHGYAHVDLTTLPITDALADIERGDAALTAAVGFRSRLFRFPMFASTPELIAAAHSRGMAVVHANIVTEDWRIADPDELLAHSLAAVDSAGGGIVLFHDIQPQTAAMLDAFITEVRARGYTIATVRPRQSLADLGRAHGVRIGSVVWTPEDVDPRSWRRAVTELDLFTVPSYFRLVQPERGRFDFAIPDATSDAAPPGTALRVHNLVWCELNPEWITDDLSGEELAEILVSHVRAVVAHHEERHPGAVIAYDVVNEPLSWTGDGCPWHRIGLDAGEDELAYVELALRTAREAAPDTALYLNDFGIEGLTDRADRMLELATQLIAAGVPLDGVGFESHFTAGSDALFFGRPPPEDEIVDNIERFAELGLEISITEADMPIPADRVGGDTLVEQARSFGALARVCVQSEACVAFVTWGVGDSDSWILDTYPGWETPLLFDTDYEPKPAYFAVREALR